MEYDNAGSAETVELAASIVSAYVGNNHVAVAELPSVIAAVFGALSSLGQVAAEPVKEAVALVPAVPVKKSITPDYIICLEDGKQFKSMKRHLATKFGLTPDEYRRKWSLPSDYPMVAAGYATKRSELALALGLGRKKSETVSEPAAAAKPARAKKPKATEAEAA
jgi:predicted transcriptional regulator